MYVFGEGGLVVGVLVGLVLCGGGVGWLFGLGVVVVYES